MAIKNILKTVEDYRVENKEQVDAFERELREDADANDYTLGAFSWTEKMIKESGEVVDSYFVVRVTKVFDKAKEPEKPYLKSVKYEFNYME